MDGPQDLCGWRGQELSTLLPGSVHRKVNCQTAGHRDVTVTRTLLIKNIHFCKKNKRDIEAVVPRAAVFSLSSHCKDT